MGWKKLYLYDKAGSRSEAIVYCLLDFYIHESRQRKGYGKFLIDYMLEVQAIANALQFNYILIFSIID